MKCHDCSRPAQLRPDGTYASRCRACAKARRDAAYERRQELRRLGQCAYQGGCERDVVPGRAMCAYHLELARVRKRVT